MLDVSDLQSAFDFWPWSSYEDEWRTMDECPTLSRGEVATAIREGWPDPGPYSTSDGEYREFTRREHIARIAAMVAGHHAEPIVVEEWRGEITVVDGWHRVTAAVYRGDATINAVENHNTRLRVW